MTGRRVAVALAVLALGACARAPSTRDGSELSVEWASDDSTIGRGTWRGRADAGWCQSTRQLTVMAVRGDSGAALLVMLPALGPADSVPLLHAGDTLPATRAVLALRWPDARALHALASDSGTLRLTRVEPTLTGEFHGRLGLKDSAAVPPTVRGRFDGVAVLRGDAGCRLAGVGPAPATGVP